VRAYVARLLDRLDFVEAAPILCAGVTTYKGLKGTDTRPGEWVVISGVGGLGHLKMVEREMMKVREVARRSGVPDHVVRYYTRIGLLKPSRSPHNRYKQYKDSDVSRLRFIRQAKSLGYTLGEIARIFHESSRGNSPCPMVRQIIEGRIEENGCRLNELAALQQRMEHALAEWAELPDGMPDGESVCYLIESAAHV